ncbi:MAG: glycosyltransferase family 9 protein [Candidatus Polarisedimenticolia bacterium]
MKILMIRLSAIGDVVRTLPALTCLRRAFPEARIDWAVEEPSRPIVGDQPHLDHTLVFPRARLARVLLHPDEILPARAALSRFLSDLKEARYDLVIDFQGTIKSALLARATRAPRIVGLGPGHAREMSHLFYSEKVALPRRGMSRVERALALVAHLGIDTREATSDIPESADDAAYVESFLGTLPTPARAPAVIFPGTSRTQEYKRYPAEHFARVASLMADRVASPVVVAWGPGEKHLAEDIVAAAGPGRALMAPSLTLGQLTALIRRAQVFVAGDTGPMHIAWTVGTPLVAVYGPTDPVVNRPGGRFSVVAYEKVFCSPCRNRGCIARTCLHGLAPETVASAAVDVVEQASAAGRHRAHSLHVLQPTAGLRFETMGPGTRPRPGN